MMGLALSRCWRAMSQDVGEFAWLCPEDQRTVAEQTIVSALDSEGAIIDTVHATIRKYELAIARLKKAGESNPDWFTLDTQNKFEQRIQFLKGMASTFEQEEMTLDLALDRNDQMKSMVFTAYAKTANVAAPVAAKLGERAGTVAQRIGGWLGGLAARPDQPAPQTGDVPRFTSVDQFAPQQEPPLFGATREPSPPPQREAFGNWPVASGSSPGGAPMAPSAAFAAFPVAEGAEVGRGSAPQKFNLSPDQSPVMTPKPLPEPVVATLSMTPRAVDRQDDSEKPELCD
jgi:hypothetical protein